MLHCLLVQTKLHHAGAQERTQRAHQFCWCLTTKRSSCFLNQVSTTVRNVWFYRKTNKTVLYFFLQSRRKHLTCWNFSIHVSCGLGWCPFLFSSYCFFHIPSFGNKKGKHGVKRIENDTSSRKCLWQNCLDGMLLTHTGKKM